MSRNESQTCRELIEPALKQAGWSWDRQVFIGPGRVNLVGESMYDPSQRIVADYLLRLWKMPLAILEAKAEGEPAADGKQQASRYANSLGLRFSITTNGREFILTDNKTGEFESLATIPTPGDILSRLGRNIVWEEWRPVFPVLGTEPTKTRVRAKLFKQLCRHLTKPTPDHVSVIGPEFIGKSVLLQHLAEYFKSGRDPYKTSFYWDMRRSAADSDRDFKQRLAVELKKSLQQVLPDLGAEIHPESDSIGQTLQTALDILQDEGIRILGVLDGFDRVLATASLTRNLWDYMLDLARRSSLRLVTGSQRRLQELCRTPDSRTSEFWEIFCDTPLRVGPSFDSDSEG